ncbi:MAG: sigma 54-interacting transcriptional regulator [Ignavibacteriaceae bacterium]|nr:sigma 54-interacting transcriptional regulator [Ignavibacteriaceae bacterium]
MGKRHIIIKVYSDMDDVSSIHSAIKQLELKSLPVHPSYAQRFAIAPDSIIILQINNVESKYLTRLLKIRNGIKNKIIFVVPENNALLVSSLAKLGFSNIFIFPYELYMFISYIEEIIVNNTYLTTAGVPGGNDEDIYDFNTIIGSSKNFLRTLYLARKVSTNKDVNILIRGETGTGKGLLARAIHNSNKGDSGPFVDIICSSIPENLLESELFGYEPGAFTNAKNRKIGLFELAENGTLFLDEIGDLSLNIQKKLLRAIDKKLIRHLGGISDIPIHTRIISATNMNLEELIKENIFRADLYHRLNTINIEIPPLRSREGDALQLAEHFINEFKVQFNKDINKLTNDAKDFISNYAWPGNVREIRNAIERAVLLTEDNTIKFSDLAHILKTREGLNKDNIEEMVYYPDQIRLNILFAKTNMKALDKIYAKEVLKKANGNKSLTSRILKISRPKLDKVLN